MNTIIKPQEDLSDSLPWDARRRPFRESCPVCKTLYDRTPSQASSGKKTTCSRACSYVFRFRNRSPRNIQFIERKCDVCDAYYKADASRVKHGRQLTCSKSCSRQKKSTKLKCSIPRRDKSRISPAVLAGVCETCSCQFAKRNRKAQFCSVQCRGKARRIADKICPNCSNSFNLGSVKRVYCSRACFLEAHKTRMSGAGNPSYIDGRSKNKRSYRGDDWEDVRRQVYKRDRYTCRHCLIKCVSRKRFEAGNTDGKALIQCHHLEPWSATKNNDLSNLITLCASCHKKTHENSE